MNRSKFTVDSFLFSTDPFLHLLGESFVKIDDGNGIFIATVLEVMNEGGTERKYLFEDISGKRSMVLCAVEWVDVVTVNGHKNHINSELSTFSITALMKEVKWPFKK